MLPLGLLWKSLVQGGPFAGHYNMQVESAQKQAAGTRSGSLFPWACRNGWLWTANGVDGLGGETVGGSDEQLDPIGPGDERRSIGVIRHGKGAELGERKGLVGKGAALLGLKMIGDGDGAVHVDRPAQKERRDGTEATRYADGGRRADGNQCDEGLG